MIIATKYKYIQIFIAQKKDNTVTVFTVDGCEVTAQPPRDMDQSSFSNEKSNISVPFITPSLLQASFLGTSLEFHT
jgi:hypothetical protein